MKYKVVNLPFGCCVGSFRLFCMCLIYLVLVIFSSTFFLFSFVANFFFKYLLIFLIQKKKSEKSHEMSTEKVIKFSNKILIGMIVLSNDYWLVYYFVICGSFFFGSILVYMHARHCTMIGKISHLLKLLLNLNSFFC